MNPVQWLRKAAGTLPAPLNRAFSFAWFNTKYHLPGDYNANNAANSAIVGSCINALWRSLAATPLKVYQGDGDQEVSDARHVLSPLLEPNSRHTYSNLLWQTIRDLVQAGEVIYRAIDSNSVQVIPWEAIIQQLPNYDGQTCLLYTSPSPRDS